MSRPLRNDNGIALVTALLFLLVLSVLVTALHYTTILEHVSSRKYQNSQQSFYAAEKGVRRGMGWLAAQGGPPEEALTADPWFFPEPLDGAPIWADAETADGCTNTYYIEHLKKEASTVTGHESSKKGTTTSTGSLLHYYRITGKGSSRGTPAGTVVLQLVTTVTY